MNPKLLLKALPFMLLLTTAQGSVNAADQVLASVGSLNVTATELKSAMASSPFATKFPSMDKDDQASLRGDMLRRLVSAKLLTLEGKRLGLDKTENYRTDSENYRLSMLYRAYIDKLRQDIVIPDETMAEMKKQLKNDHDGIAAAKSAYISERYREAKHKAMQDLLKSNKVQLHQERISGAKADTLLAEGTNLQVRHADLLQPEDKTPPGKEVLLDRLQQRVELLVAAHAAADQGVDVSTELHNYERDRLPAEVMEAKTKEWIPNEKTLRDWYAKHPQVGDVPERRHIGHLIVDSRKLAQQLHARIIKGESLFNLAGKYSTDPVSRKQKGDIGWVVEGRGMPELEQALSKLKDDEISDVIATKDGKFHILTVLDRIPGRTESYEKIRGRIAQSIVNERLPQYLGELERRYGVTWNLLAESDDKTAAKGVK